MLGVNDYLTLFLDNDNGEAGLAYIIPHSSFIMSWKLGKSKKATLSADRDDAASTRSITPTPSDEKPRFRTGILSIRVLWAERLSVPHGTSIPAVVQAALSSQQAKVAASISPASVSQSRLAARGKRDSIQRTQCWWLPYIVMEFEVNQILITPLGGELDKPLYMYQAHLYASLSDYELLFLLVIQRRIS
jgi:serum/glucocorticoid-regulated kinase 2